MSLGEVRFKEEVWHVLVLQCLTRRAYASEQGANEQGEQCSVFVGF